MKNSVFEVSEDTDISTSVLYVIHRKMELGFSEQPILISGFDGKTSEGVIEVQVLTGMQRFLRALGRALALFFISIFSILIPILHFVLVPIGLLATCIVFSVSFAVKSLIVKGQGSCPCCGHPVKIFKRVYRVSFQDVCESCNRPLTIQSKL